MTHEDARGKLSIWNPPFKIKRVFFITEPKGVRANHITKETNEFVICLQGSCRIDIDKRKRRIKELETLLIPKGKHRILDEFSYDCILAVLADTQYNPQDNV